MHSREPGQEQGTPPELAALVEAVTAERMSALEAGYAAVEQGYLLIGTALPDVVVHVPPPDAPSMYYDISLRHWVLVDELDSHILRATDRPPQAIMCALFGDYNDRTQRTRLGEALTVLKPPHFGWSRNGDTLHAIPEVIEAVQQRGGNIRGYLDVVSKDDFWPTSHEPGHYLTTVSHRTLARIPLDGTDLPHNIAYVRYPQFQEETSGDA